MLSNGANMTKRAVVFLVLLFGVGAVAAYVTLAGPLTYTVNPKTIGFQMLFWGVASATISAATTAGRWGEKIDLTSARKRRLPGWLLPVSFVLLAIANYLIAIAVVAGAWPFMPGRGSAASQ
jgi:membrane protease YdiL (CAAX protease family)